MKNTTIRIFKAVLRYDKSHEFFEHHIATLKYYGIENISSVSPKWKYNPYTYLVVAECNITQKIIGGVRLELDSPFDKLPIQEALESTSEEIHVLLEQLKPKGRVAELCGLWVNPEIKKANLSIQIMKKAIELADALKVKTTFGFANKHSKPLTELLGFNNVNTIENEGLFYYPDPRYETQVVMRESSVKINDCIPEHILS